VTATVKVADCPVDTVWLTGCVVINGAAAVLPALLTMPEHPERENPASRTKTERSPNFLVPSECVAALIWPRQLDKLRAEIATRAPDYKEYRSRLRNTAGLKSKKRVLPEPCPCVSMHPMCSNGRAYGQVREHLAEMVN